jgi:hypothetical protein
LDRRREVGDDERKRETREEKGEILFWVMGWRPEAARQLWISRSSVFAASDILSSGGGPTECGKPNGNSNCNIIIQLLWHDLASSHFLVSLAMILCCPWALRTVSCRHGSAQRARFQSSILRTHAGPAREHRQTLCTKYRTSTYIHASRFKGKGVLQVLFFQKSSATANHRRSLADCAQYEQK